jgi:hypothetical protein
MQATGSAATGSGWSRRTRLIVGIGALVFLVAWFAYLTVEYIYPGSLSPPSKTRQAEVVAEITGNVRREYGPALASVHVWYGRDGVIPTYFGRYRLKVVPLLFAFSVRDSDFWHSPGYPPPSPDGVGGLNRFVQLATAFHADFPAAEAMDWWTVGGGQELPEPLRHLEANPGPTVVVYGSSLPSPALGIYAWDAGRRTWRLVHRGPLPETQQ